MTHESFKLIDATEQQEFIDEVRVLALSPDGAKMPGQERSAGEYRACYEKYGLRIIVEVDLQDGPYSSFRAIFSKPAHDIDPTTHLVSSEVFELYERGKTQEPYYREQGILYDHTGHELPNPIAAKRDEEAAARARGDTDSATLISREAQNMGVAKLKLEALFGEHVFNGERHERVMRILLALRPSDRTPNWMAGEEDLKALVDTEQQKNFAQRLGELVAPAGPNASTAEYAHDERNYLISVYPTEQSSEAGQREYSVEVSSFVRGMADKRHKLEIVRSYALTFGENGSINGRYRKKFVEYDRNDSRLSNDINSESKPLSVGHYREVMLQLAALTDEHRIESPPSE